MTDMPLPHEVEFRLSNAILHYEAFQDECRAAIRRDLITRGLDPAMCHVTWKETLKEFETARVEYTYTLDSNAHITLTPAQREIVKSLIEFAIVNGDDDRTEMADLSGATLEDFQALEKAVGL